MVKKILSVVGARPNFMKIAPIVEELGRRNVGSVLVHTGQHYDTRMCKLFFEDLGLPRPDYDLEVGSGSHARQTGEVLMRMEPVLEAEKPDAVIVVGDVNSTLAATIAAVKLQIPLAHVEAGLRSFDRTMPEELNRLMTDAVANFLFTTEEKAARQLVSEGVDPASIHFVGNTMIDSLLKHRERADSSSVLSEVGVEPKGYGVVTLHRPSNVDDRATLQPILEALASIAQRLPLVFPVHPRTRKRIEDFGLSGLLAGGFHLTEPLGYLDFLKLNKDARVVFTDSGGIQEETTVLGVPCVTLRHNTERPVTISDGTNKLVGTSKQAILEAAELCLAGKWQTSKCPPLWDGHAGRRIVEVLVDGSTAYQARS